MKRCVILIILSTSLVAASERNNSCGVNEFECDDGVCVGVGKLCDGVKDCDDDTDERNCAVRTKRQMDLSKYLQLGNDWCNQIQGCNKNVLNQFVDDTVFRCDNGHQTIIKLFKCNGNNDCTDGSDETFKLCRKVTNVNNVLISRCIVPPNPPHGTYEAYGTNEEPRVERGNPGGLFGHVNLSVICDYGYEVQGNATECTDGKWAGDLPKCVASKSKCVFPPQPQNGRYRDSNNKNGTPGEVFIDIDLKITCDSGYKVQGTNTKCSGGEWSHPLPQCVPIPVTKSSATTGLCVLPEHPAYGRYTFLGQSDVEPGQAFEFVYLNVTCDPGFGPVDNTDVFCMLSKWNNPLPQCTRYCKLMNHPGIEYKCLVAGRRSLRGTRDCSEYEPHGTVVMPECKKPNYFFPGRLPYMHCIDGSWDHTPICKPECGRITPSAEELIINGTKAQRGELPWHAGIYSKTSTPYRQICGGSLVSNKIVISAAHCFWDSTTMTQPASNYAVAVGKLYRPWNNPVDESAQKSDVNEIKLPSRFRGMDRNLENDIAVLVLTTSIEFRTYVRPICIDFELDSNRPLRSGIIGKVAGWGYTTPKGNPSGVLKTVSMPFIPSTECESRVPQMYIEYLTADKICAGYTNGTALCKGDSGGGLAFPEWDGGVVRYYLRGVVSASPTDQNLCNAYAITGFTNITAHKDFIEENI